MGRSIVVIGANCQVNVLAGCLSLLSPGAEVIIIGPSRFAHRYGSDPARVLEAVAAADLVVSHPLESRKLAFVDGEAVRAAARRFVGLPVIYFTAFHPDVVHVLRARKPTPSVIGGYHSSLVLYGHACGLTADAIVSLFREEVFARAGYFDAWFPAQEALIDLGRTAGFDLGSLFAGWMRRGCFMHTVNHPKLHVLGDLARQALAGAGLPALPVACEDYLTDPLGASVWPLYPEIAARMGLRGSYAFKLSIPPGSVAEDARACIGLEEFVARSLALYTDCPDIARHCPRVARWLADPAMRDALRPDAR